MNSLIFIQPLLPESTYLKIGFIEFKYGFTTEAITTKAQSSITDFKGLCSRGQKLSLLRKLMGPSRKIE